MSNRVFALIEWLRDPFGRKHLTERHTQVRERMLKTAGRTEEITNVVRNFPIGHTLVRRKTPTKRPVTKGAGS